MEPSSGPSRRPGHRVFQPRHSTGHDMRRHQDRSVIQRSRLSPCWIIDLESGHACRSRAHQKPWSANFSICDNLRKEGSQGITPECHLTSPQLTSKITQLYHSQAYEAWRLQITWKISCQKISNLFLLSPKYRRWSILQTTTSHSTEQAKWNMWMT